MKSTKNHYHLSLCCLHKFPLSPEKWGQIATMVLDPLWKEYIKYIKSKPSSQDRLKWMSTAALSITAISHLDRGCRHKTRACGPVIWGEELNVPLFLHTHPERDRKGLQNYCTAALAGMSSREGQVKLSCSSVWFSNVSKAAWTQPHVQVSQTG